MDVFSKQLLCDTLEELMASNLPTTDYPLNGRGGGGRGGTKRAYREQAQKRKTWCGEVEERTVEEDKEGNIRRKRGGCGES